MHVSQLLEVPPHQKKKTDSTPFIKQSYICTMHVFDTVDWILVLCLLMQEEM